MKPTSGINKRRRYRDLGLELAEDFAKQGHIVHFAQSKSSPSVYIKLDYGATYTIRISDHPEREGLDYRFNLMMDMSPTELQTYKKSLPEPKHPRLFFTYEQIPLLKHAIHLSKTDRMEKMGADDYTSYIAYCKKRFENQRATNRETFAAKAKRIYSH